MIPAFDYRRELAWYRHEVDAAVARVLDSGSLILGPEVDAFEREFAAYLGTEHAVGVASGTDALILALRALDVGPGDEVVTPANTAVPTASAIRAVGAIPRFADVDPRSLLLTAETLRPAITPRTRAIIPVDLYGAPVDLGEILAVARGREVAVISDCAHAHGARWCGRPVGTMSDIGCFSFYPTKNLGACGDGGLCVTRRADLAARLRTLRNYGYDSQRIARCEGINSRLDELQAAILRVKLRHLDEGNARRRQLAERYRDGLTATPFRLQEVGPEQWHVYHQFVIRCPNRAAVIRRLEQHDIGYGIHYDPPLHRMPAFSRFHETSGLLPVVEEAAPRVLSLPIYPGLTFEEADRVLAVLRDVS